MRALKLSSKRLRATVSTLLLFILCTNSLKSYEQVLNEHRVYFVDITSSMKNNETWKKVKKSLMEALNSIDDPTTKLTFLFFQENIKNIIRAQADQASKKKIKEELNSIQLGGASTNLIEPMRYFFSNLIEPGYINYFFLLTDGQHNSTDIKNFYSYLNSIDLNTNNNIIYGFYVALCPEATDKTIEDIIINKENFWIVETSDVNLNLITLESEKTLNIRNSNRISFSVLSTNIKDPSKIKLNYQLTNGKERYKIKNLKFTTNNRIEVEIEPQLTTSQLPENDLIILKIWCNNTENYLAFIMPDELTIKIINKHEKTVRIEIL